VERGEIPTNRPGTDGEIFRQGRDRAATARRNLLQQRPLTNQLSVSVHGELRNRVATSSAILRLLIA
jgi:hypothetical protein